MAHTSLDILSIDDIITELEAHDEGWRHRGCDWDDSPCGETTTHLIVFACHSPEICDGEHVATLCARHYAAMMLDIIEVQLPLEGVELTDVVRNHGPIG